MKKLTFLLVITFLITFSMGVMANDYEFIGGGMYTTLDFSEINDEIDGKNEYLDFLEEEEDIPNVEDINKNYLDNLDSAFGIFAGMKYNLSPDNSLSGTYERFSVGTDGGINISGEISGEDESENESVEFEVDYDIDITVNG
ncbi:MAG: hypothetical protein ACOCRX_09925, partial [Candidatus Woesearchaeota archaeon]